MHLPTPGLICSTSISESSGAATGQPWHFERRTYLLTKVHIGLAREHHRLRLNALHRSVEIAVVRLLCRAVCSLPRVQHDEHVLGICNDQLWSESRMRIQHTFGQRPGFPEVQHEVFEILEAEYGLVQLLPVESLREAPASCRVNGCMGQQVPQARRRVSKVSEHDIKSDRVSEDSSIHQYLPYTRPRAFNPTVRSSSVHVRYWPWIASP